MNFERYKFSKELDIEFLATLRRRVNEHFQTRSISKYGNYNMVIKSIFMFTLYFAPLILMLTGIITNVWVLLALWMIMGLGKGGIGLSIMHDANHGAYSSNKNVNLWMGYSVNLIGANAALWKIQHNVLHHTYTNIHEADEDIDVPMFLRFSPHQKRYWIHRFQHLYVWFFYGISTLTWVTFRDFTQLARFKKKGLISEKKAKKELLQIIGWKLLYFSYILVLPMLILPVSPWMVLFFFFCMHFVTGLTLSLIFQTAHVMPTSDFPLPNEEGSMESNWAVHQLATTTNFSPRSKIFSWLIGGLNYQVEHHLFSNICHIHYKDISKIVSKTASEFNIPYYSQRNFVLAVWSHIKMLHALGRAELVPGTPSKI